MEWSLLANLNDPAVPMPPRTSINLVPQSLYALIYLGRLLLSFMTLPELSHNV